jgi:hypothetical protein
LGKEAEELEPKAQESAEAPEKDLAQVLVEVDLAEWRAELEWAAQALAQEALEEAPQAAAEAQDVVQEAARELVRAQALGLEPVGPEQEAADWDSALAAAREWDPAGPWAAATDPFWGPERDQGVVPEAEQGSDLAPAAEVAAAKEKGAAWVSPRTRTSTRSFTR